MAQAKGPNDWPYSLRSTRAKLVDLCRVRAKEVSAEQKRRNTIEEEDMDQDLEQFREVLKRTTNIKRPLYRQNSMDFMQSAKLELRGADAFSRYIISSLIYFARFDFLRTFSDIEPLTVFVNLITCSLTRPTTLIRVHHPLTLKLSISQHRPLLRLFVLRSLNGKPSLRAHLSAAQYPPYPPYPLLRRLLCGPFLVLLFLVLLCGAPIHLVKPASA